MDSLSRYLIERDTQIQLPENSEVKRIQIAIENMIGLILKSVQAKDSRLAGRLLKVGSYYSGLKIGLPDEFDFVYELNSFTEGEDFKVMPSGFKSTTNLWRTPVGDPAKKKVFLRKPEKFSKVDVPKEDPDQWLVKVANGEFVLDQIGVKNTLYFKIMEVLKNLKPSQFHHNLDIDLSEEGTFIHGPAITLFFLWKGRRYKNLKISVDVTVALKATDQWQEYFDFFQASNEEENGFLVSIIAKEIGTKGYHLVPYISDHGRKLWKISTSFLETQICSRFSKNSSFKQLIRVLKAAKDEHLRFAPSLDFLKDEMSANALRFHQFYFGEDFDDQHHLVSSYLIKAAVFKLCNFATLPEWKKASLGTLYLLAITSLFNFLSIGIFKDVFISKNKLKVPEYGDILPGFHCIFQEAYKIFCTPEKQGLSKKTSNEEISWENLIKDPFKNAKAIFQKTKEQVDWNLSCIWQEPELKANKSKYPT